MFFWLYLLYLIFLLIFYLFKPLLKNIHSLFSFFFRLRINFFRLLELRLEFAFDFCDFFFLHLFYLVQFSLVYHPDLYELLLKLEVFFNFKINLFLETLLKILSLFEMSFVQSIKSCFCFAFKLIYLIFYSFYSIVNIIYHSIFLQLKF